LEELHGPKRVVATVNAKVVKRSRHDKKVWKASCSDEPDEDDDEDKSIRVKMARKSLRDLEALQGCEKFARKRRSGADGEEQMHVLETGQNFQNNNNAHHDTEDHSPRSTSYRNDFASPGVTVSINTIPCWTPWRARRMNS
jgi:hypothetical protein